MRGEKDLVEFAQKLQAACDRVGQLSHRVGQPVGNPAELLANSLEELQTMMAEMQVAEEELRSQNEALIESRAAAEAQHQRYQDLFDFAPDAYLVTDANGQIQEANLAAATLLNISQKYLIGKPFLIFIPEEERQDFRQELIYLQQRERVQDWEVRLQPRHGQPLDAALTVATVRQRDGQAIALRWMLRDISEQQAALRERKRTEERLRLLESAVVNANDAIIITEAGQINEPGPRILYVNAAFTRMTGYSPEEVVSKSPRFLHGPKTDRAVLDTIRSALENWQSIIVEVINYRKDGSEFWVELSLVPVADATGSYTHWVSVQRDITERKQAEEERAQLMREQVAREEAEAANHAKDEFIAVVSHELRTPLNSMLGWTQLIRSRHLNETNLAKAIETIERNAKSQAKLIEDLLELSRIAKGKIRLQRLPLNPISVIETVINSVLPTAEAKAIQLDTYLDPSIGFISADPERLQQIVGNLLSNAIKFTPEGGRVELRLEKLPIADCRLQMGKEEEQSKMFCAQIQVRDTGKGISPDFLPYVFERFRQAAGVQTNSNKGLGLGLAIARHLVEMHGGTIHAESPGEGQGSTFSVRLPLLSHNELHPSNNNFANSLNPSPSS